MMSKATKRKHVTREVLEDFVAPTGEQTIVKVFCVCLCVQCLLLRYLAQVVCGKGNNLHEVETPSGQRMLVSMPTKFRRNVWIKRGSPLGSDCFKIHISSTGDFVIVAPIPEGQKVQAEIEHILYPKQIKDLCDQKLWYDAVVCRLHCVNSNPFLSQAICF